MSNNVKVDVVVGLSWGDEGKGKVTKSLLESGKYTHCVRYNGGGNAGHTVYHNGEKVITHLIPAGVFYGIPSIIGSGCVVNVKKFFEELKMLEGHGIDTSCVKIANSTHIVTDSHIEEDSKDTKIGTTKSGNGPCYRDKYSRTGLRASDVPELRGFTIDLYEEFYNNFNNIYVLMEGAQGFNLDIDHGDYPYVTSSHTGVAGALLTGFPAQAVENVWGVSKVYDTYVGTASFQPSNEPALNDLQRIGEEFGATTGRIRQCNWLDVSRLAKSVQMNGVTHLVLNKCDVLNQVGEYKALLDGRIVEVDNEDGFIGMIKSRLPSGIQLIRSSSPKGLWS